MDYNFDNVCRTIRVGSQAFEAIYYSNRKDISTTTKIWLTVLAAADLALCFKDFHHHHKVLEWIALGARIVVCGTRFSSRGDLAITGTAQTIALTKTALKVVVVHFDVRKLAESRIQDALSGAEILLRLAFLNTVVRE